MEDKLTVIFLVDATGSMSSSLDALHRAADEVFPILALLCPSAQTYFIKYRDFDLNSDAEIYSCHGPYTAHQTTDLVTVVKNTRAMGGGDGPEAQKYALHRMMGDLSFISGKKVVFHFTDAPPHSLPYQNRDNSGKEAYTMRVNGFEPDWIRIGQELFRQNYSIYTLGVLNSDAKEYYSVLSAILNTNTVVLEKSDPLSITRAFSQVFAGALGYSDCHFNDLGYLVELGSTLPTNEPLGQVTVVKVDNQGRDYDILNSIGDYLSAKRLETEYKHSAEFRLLCHQTFVSLIKTGHLMAISYNPILGALYRLMCRRSSDVDADARRSELSALMSTTASKLSPSDRELYDRWQEDSYNRSEEIRELTLNAPTMVPFLYLQVAGRRLTKKEIVTGATRPMPQNLADLTSLVTNIVMITERPKVMPEVFVPLSFSNKELFSLLSHLMCPGTVLDFRPSVVMALISLHTGHPVLARRAREYLLESRGKWFNREEPEYFLFGFIKMVVQYPEILLPEEYDFLVQFKKLGSVMYNNPELEVHQIYRPDPEVGVQYPDHKIKCPTCNQFRSLSVTPTAEKCGLCCSYPNSESMTDEEEHKSYIYTCSVCKGLYAIQNRLIYSAPKCHYCRQGLGEVPHVTCELCDSKLIIPNNKLKDRYHVGSSYLCCFCSGEERRETTTLVRFHDILAENPWITTKLLGCKFDPNAKLSLYKLSKIIVCSSETVSEQPLQVNGRKVLNEAEIMMRITELCTLGNVQLETCNICFDDFLHSNLESMCRKCNARACKGCLKNWYGTNTPGLQFLHRRMNCPCCDTVPHLKVLKEYNKDLYTARCSNDITPYSLEWHYAWCLECKKVKEYMARECAGPDPFEIQNYICEDCRSPGHIKGCPKCGVLTQKSSGCDHMECPYCKIHWCYRCPKGEAFISEHSKEVYDHLNDVHGNIWGADE
jgi:hypothetical protein